MMINFISKCLEFIELLICEKIAGVIFVWTKWEEKWQRHSNTKNAFRCQILVLRDGGACVFCKMSFPTFQVCTLWLVALFQQGAHHLTLSPLFVSYWDMMKCIFFHRFLLLCSLSCEQARREQGTLILVAVEVGPPVISGVLQLVTSMSYCALPFRWNF